MDYNKIKTFIVVAQKNSVTEAAQELGRTQSAITQQVKLLEDELGMTLFERKHARIYLTKEGERLFAAGSRLLGGLDDAVLNMKDELRAVEGILRVGVLEDYGTAVFGAVIAAFKKAYPRVLLHVVYGTSEMIEDQLVANQLDIGVLITFKDKSFFEIKPLRSDDHILVTSPPYLHTNGPLKTIEQVIDADLIDFNDDFICIGTWVRKNRSDLVQRLLRRKPAVKLESHSGVKAILLQGFGLAVLPRYLVASELEDGSLVQLMKSTKVIRAGLDVAMRKKRTERLVDKLFIDVLVKHSHGDI